MAIVQLNITEKRPIVQLKGNGPKTLFVFAERNWPAAAGQAVPSIPNDILIEVQLKHAGIYSTDVFSLPAVGVHKNYLADEIIAYAEYSNQQGLGAPYVTYMIHGNVVPQYVPKTEVSRTFKFPASANQQNYPAGGAAAPAPIPSFSSEFRLKSNGWGLLRIQENVGVGVPQYFVDYDFGELEDWKQLDPMSTEYFFTVIAGPYGLVAYPPVGVTLEFR